MEHSNEPVRVLEILAGLGMGGAETMIMNLYRHMDRSKVQLDFVITYPHMNHYIAEVEALGGKVYVLPVFNGHNPIQVRHAWKKFLDEHAEYKLAHCHIWSYVSLFLPELHKHNVKIIAHSHCDSNGHGFQARVKDVMQRPISKQADYFMACSQKAGEWLFGKEIANSDRFWVLKNAIEAEKFVYNQEIRTDARIELGYSNDDYVVGFLSRVTYQKKPEFLIDIAHELYNRKMHDVKFLIVGDGELLNPMKRQVKDSGLEDKFVFTGTRSDSYRMYNAMDVYVLPSRFEGLSITTVEAQAAGLISIISDEIPQEAIVTNLTRTVTSIDDASLWADEIQWAYSQRGENRQNTLEQVREHGYDVSDTCVWVQDRYLEWSK